MKKLFLLFLLIFLSVGVTYASDNVSSIFPTVAELPGGQSNWVHSLAPVDEKAACKIYSATYAYFTYQSKPLFDIPRKNVYSVNIRLHECPSIEAATELYEQFADVGEDDRKNMMSVGERGLLYVVPSPQSPLMGDYYLNSLFRYMVLQVHADDGFVLMDVAEMMDKRLASYLRRGEGDVSNGLTLHLSGEGFAESTKLVGFNAINNDNVSFSGILYDQYNRRAVGVDVTVLETGAKAITNADGEFHFALGGGEEEAVEIFRTLSIERLSGGQLTLPDGFYQVDMSYTNTGDTGQYYWKLTNDAEGNIAGSSYRISTADILNFSGKIDKDGNINIDRPCGASVLGMCMQRFKGEKREGVIEGTWSGSGGGGEWRLYLDSFSIRNSSPSLKEAGFEMTAKDAELTNDSHIPIGVAGPHSDFMVDSVRLSLDIRSAEAPATLYLYGIQDNESVFVDSQSTAVIADNRTRAVFDVTDIYKSPLYGTYQLRLSEGDNMTAYVSPTLELRQALPKAKMSSAGLLSARVISYESADIVSNVKPIRPDGRADIAIELRLQIYGQSLNGLGIASSGTGGKRQWSTYTDNVYPAVAVMVGDTLINPETTLSYQLNGFENVLTLYIDKGSLTEKDIAELSLTVYIDGEKLTVPVANLPPISGD